MARPRKNGDICLYCFGTLNSDRFCTSCGKKADDTPAPPHHLGKRTLLYKRYLIDRAIGEGGFGITYRAWDITSGKRVAIKEYFPSGYVSRDPRSNNIIINSRQSQAPSNRGLKRFIDEAQNLSKITDHSGIVEVLNFFSANSTAYIVMEFLDGISLKNYIKRKGGKLAPQDALTILKPVILSLKGVHDLGLIHRDISPDNILITRSGEVKLIDFGAAKFTGENAGEVSIVLKQGFAPEEQYRVHGEQGPWTDIYALGVTLYFALTGQLPPESIQRMYEDSLLPPSKLGVKISKPTENAIMKMLAVFAKDRYRSIDALVDDLYSTNPRDTEESQVTMTVESDGQIRVEPKKRATRTSTAKSEKTQTTGARNSKIERKSTADDLRKKINSSAKLQTTPPPPAEPTVITPAIENPEPSRYKKVERKYGKDFKEQLEKKLKK